jgi:hypothetical protein
MRMPNRLPPVAEGRRAKSIIRLPGQLSTENERGALAAFDRCCEWGRVTFTVLLTHRLRGQQAHSPNLKALEPSSAWRRHSLALMGPETGADRYGLPALAPISGCPEYLKMCMTGASHSARQV